MAVRAGECSPHHRRSIHCGRTVRAWPRRRQQSDTRADPGQDDRETALPLGVPPRARRNRGLAGGLCPNAPLIDGRRFDDVAAGRFTIVTSTTPTPAQRATLEARGAVLVMARPGDPLHTWLHHGHATTAVVRPDGTVLRAGRDLARAFAAAPIPRHTGFALL